MSRCAGWGSGGWDHSWQPKKWNCTVCGESNHYDRARCRGCEEHVGKRLQKAAADSGKRSSGKGTGVLVDQDAIRWTQHAKTKAETQGKLQALEKTIKAMEDNEHTLEYKRQMKKKTLRNFEEVESKQNWTDGEEKRIETLEEEPEVARKSLEVRNTDLKQQLEELKELEEANAIQKQTKSRKKLGTREDPWRRRHGRRGSGVRRIFEIRRTELEKTGKCKRGRTLETNQKLTKSKPTKNNRP